MNYRAAFVVSTVLLLGSLLLNMPGRNTQAQEAVPTKPEVERYRMTLGAFDGRQAIVVCDTMTGQCWVKSSTSKTWKDYGSPVAH